MSRGAAGVGAARSFTPALVPASLPVHKQQMDDIDALPRTNPVAAMRALARRAGRAALDYALPPRCPGCGAVVPDDDSFCLPCWRSLDFLDRPSCALCSMPLGAGAADGMTCGACLAQPPPFIGAPAALAYGPVARAVALRLKYGRRLGHARLMAKLMARKLPPPGGAPLLLIPVPLHRWRIWSRGFNQAALVADALAGTAGVETDPLLLIRHRHTPSMRGRGRRERSAAVRGAFALADGAKTRLKGRHVVLIDDVHASGATLHACARALRGGGAAAVSALTWARVVPQDLLADGQDIDFAALDSDIGATGF
jgi:ComF family protein